MVKKVMMLLFLLLVLVFPVSSYLDIIEDDIANYTYIRTRISNASSYINEEIVYYPVYHIRYNDTHGNIIYTTVINFDNDTFGRYYLDVWINDKINEDQSFLYNNYFLFKLNRSRNNLVWRNRQVYVQVGFQNNYSDIPNEIINAYLEIYPSDCLSKECPNLDKDLIERIYNKFFLGYYYQTEGLFFKHNGFSVKCKNIVKYGKNGAIRSPDLTYEQFRIEVSNFLANSMYFSDEELSQLYNTCFEKEFINIKGIPLDGFLKECYEQVSSILPIDYNHEIDETSLKLCDNLNLIITKNNEYFDTLIRDDPDFINKMISFLVQKELNKVKGTETICENIDEEFDECSKYNIKYEDNEEIESESLDIENRSNSIPIEKNLTDSISKDDFKYQEDVVVTLNNHSLDNNIQQETFNNDTNKISIEKQDKIYQKIFSFFKSLFS